MASVAHAQGIIVNEASNGPSGAKEFYELLVVGSAANPTGPVNLHDWIIDDNNGDWEGSVSGVGIAPGYMRFDAMTDSENCTSLLAMPPGSILVVYNDGDPNPNLPADDLNDTNRDGVYVFPARGSCMKTCSGPPDSSDSSYASCTTPATPSYSVLALRNSGDVAQSRDQSGTLFHGFAFGDLAPPYPAGSFLIETGSGARSTYLFSCGDWHSGTDYSKSSTSSETPGSTNNSQNGIFRQKVQTGAYNYTDPESASNCQAGTASLTGTKEVAVWDPDTEGLYAIPGNDVIYTFTVTNTGDAEVDMDTINISDELPEYVAFYNGDIDGTGPATDPVIGIDNGSSLSLTYAADVAFANTATKPANFSACTYAPLIGYDPNVTFICLNPKGAMAFGDPDPEFIIRFRVRIK